MSYRSRREVVISRANWIMAMSDWIPYRYDRPRDMCEPFFHWDWRRDHWGLSPWRSYRPYYYGSDDAYWSSGYSSSAFRAYCLGYADGYDHKSLNEPIEIETSVHEWRTCKTEPERPKPVCSTERVDRRTVSTTYASNAPASPYREERREEPPRRKKQCQAHRCECCKCCDC